MEWTTQAMQPIFFGLLRGPSLLVECGPFPHARAGRVLDERWEDLPVQDGIGWQA